MAGPEMIQRELDLEGPGFPDGFDSEGFPGGDARMGERPSERQVGGTHYKDLKIQPGFFSEANKLSHMRGEAIDYIVRSQVGGGEKQDPTKDLLKAIHCIELVLEWEHAYVRTKDTIA